MDTIFFQDDDELNLRFYENEPSKATEGQMRFNDLPLPGLHDQNTEVKIERRRHKRFSVNVYAFALIRCATTKPLVFSGRSMGEMACAVYRSKPAKLGRIKNISMGGLMFRCVDNEVRSKESLVLDILLADCKFYMASLEFRSISELLLPNDFPNGFVQMKQLHVEFERLAPYQVGKLEYFIRENISPSKRNFDFGYS